MFNGMEKTMFKIALKKLGKWMNENKNGKINFDLDQLGLKKANDFLKDYGFEISQDLSNGFNFKYIGE